MELETFDSLPFFEILVADPNENSIDVAVSGQMSPSPPNVEGSQFSLPFLHQISRYKEKVLVFRRIEPDSLAAVNS